MPKKTKKTPSIRDEYPDHPSNYDCKPVAQRSGNKVGWATFATKEEAERVAAWATVEAEIKARQGFDFGYQCPGSIREVAGGYEVCLP